jgi:predicted nucleic acid-binding Zn ribbon protein
VPLGVNGDSKAARDLQDMLRQRALSYAEPVGALQSYLYHQFPKVMTAPIVVQYFAKQHFFNICTIATAFISFLVAWLLASDPQTQSWIGLIYFIICAGWLIKPYSNSDSNPLKTSHIIGLVVASILLPIFISLLSSKLPDLNGLTFHLQTFVLLFCAMVSSILLFFAALGQTTDAPATQVSNELLRMSMQAPPASMFEELARRQQTHWTENIPNRCYARIEPQTPIGSGSGTFTGELFEETQPLPMKGRNVSDTAGMFADRSRKFLAMTDIFAVVLTILVTVFVVLFIRHLSVNIDWVSQRWNLLSGASMMLCVALFCFQNASRLWGRFDFESTLLWVTAQGSYQTSKLGTGNQFSSQLQTENKLVRVEDMTVNIWRARIESVSYGSNTGRQLTAMFATQQEAKQLAADLLSYVGGQSVLAAPNSSMDLQKIAAISQASEALRTGESTPTLTPALEKMLGGTAVKANTNSAASTAALKNRFCNQCGQTQTQTAKFCSDCGSSL